MNKRYYLIVIFFFIIFKYSINSANSNIIYDKNDIIVTNIDLNQFKKIYYDNENEKLNNADALKKIIFYKETIYKIKLDQPELLSKLDEEINTQINFTSISNIHLDYIRFKKIKSIYVREYFYEEFQISELKKIFNNINKIELPISKNNCQTFEALIDFKNDELFLKNFFNNIKENKNDYTYIYNNEKYLICMSQKNFKILEKLILNYIGNKVLDNIKKYTYNKKI